MKKQEKKEELANFKIPRDLWWELKKLSVNEKKNFREYVMEVLEKEVDKNKEKDTKDKDDEIKLF